MKRVIILEGPDGGGKTTLAEVLKKKIPGSSIVRHGTYPDDTKETLWKRYLYAMLPACLGLETIIMDRAWQSEPIYGTVYRDGANRITTQQANLLVRCAATVKGMIVWCVPPLDVSEKVWASRQAEEYVKSRAAYRKIHTGYRVASRRSTAPLGAVTFDYSNMTKSSRSIDLVLHSVKWSEEMKGFSTHPLLEEIRKCLSR